MTAGKVFRHELIHTLGLGKDHNGSGKVGFGQLLHERRPVRGAPGGLAICYRPCCSFGPLLGGSLVGRLVAVNRLALAGIFFGLGRFFERDFVLLCFALATGVGKTRLMGAFIAYLHAVYSVNNFFVLAPNLTIYNKLMRDFTPGTPKYVFTGLANFAQFPPI